MSPKAVIKPDIIDQPGHLTSQDAAILLDEPGDISEAAYGHQSKCAKCRAAMLELSRMSFAMALAFKKDPALQTVSQDQRDAMLAKVEKNIPKPSETL